MAPRLKFTKEQMITAALDLVRREGTAALTARSLAEALGTSTQPVFTCFGSMDEAKREVKTAAQSLFREYIKNGLDSDIPFFGVGMQYIAFAKDEPQLYRLLFLNGEGSISDAVKELGATVREPLTRIYSLTAEEADFFFRDMWLVVHSIAALTVSGDCGYGEKEISGILTGFSIAVCKAIKEVPGFVSGTFDRNKVFAELVSEKSDT